MKIIYHIVIAGGRKSYPIRLGDTGVPQNSGKAMSTGNGFNAGQKLAQQNKPIPPQGNMSAQEYQNLKDGHQTASNKKK